MKICSTFLSQTTCDKSQVVCDFFNEGKSAASFCHRVAACVPNMFWKFYLVKNYKIAENSTTTKAREKISTESLEFYNFLMFG
jgi:hypothetical protein